MKIYLVRHGQTGANHSNRSQSNSEPLNQTGFEQAKKLGLKLKGTHFDIAYVSDALRAMQTADKILEHHPNLKRVNTARLRELNRGVFETIANDKRLAWEAEQTNKGIAFGDLKPENGESRYDLQKRIKAVFDEIVKSHPDQTVLLVSHCAAIYSLLADLSGIHMNNRADITPLSCKNTGVSIINVENSNISIEIVNDLSHLN